MLHRPWVTEARLSLTFESPTNYEVFNIPYAFGPFHTGSLDHRSIGTWLDDLEDREHTITASTKVSPLY